MIYLSRHSFLGDFLFQSKEPPICRTPETVTRIWNADKWFFVGSNYMASGIYKIRNVINGKVYIGSAVNISKRWNIHTSSLKNEKHHSKYLQNAWLKYGADAFEFSVIEECSKEKLIEREQYFIDMLSPEYNVCRVAGSQMGMKHSDEARAKIGVASRNISAETRLKLSIASSNRSEETRAKLSKARRNMSDEWRAKIGAAWKGVKRPPFSIEHRAKLSAANKGKPARNKGKTVSSETRAKISASVKEWWASKAAEKLEDSPA